MGDAVYTAPVIIWSGVFSFGLQGRGNTAGFHCFLEETLLFCCSFPDCVECAGRGNRISFTTLTEI